MLPRSTSAASQICFSNPMVAELFSVMINLSNPNNTSLYMQLLHLNTEGKKTQKKTR